MWEYIPFENCLEKTKIKFKLSKKDYRDSGKYPIVSQEESLINGYHNDISYIFKVAKPIVVFGDHTLALKYIDFDFIVGADGVKILQPKETINSKYFYYVLKALMPKTTGYARHYKFLKKLDIPVPPLEEQEHIVTKLDAAFVEIDKAISKEEVKEMENEKLKAKILSNFLHHKDWDKYKLNEICLIKNGGTPKTKIESYWDGDIKWLTPKDMGKINGKFASDSERKISNDGLKNSSAKLIPSESLILSCRAPIGHVFINKIEMSFNQGCKGLVINENEKVNVEYLYYFLLSSKKLLNDLGTGTTFKEISSKVLGNVEIALPVFHKQEEIIAKLNAAFSEIENIKQFIESKKQNYAALKAAILSKELQSSEAA